MNDDTYTFDKISKELKNYTTAKAKADDPDYFGDTFIWGVKSLYDVSDGEPSGITMNDVSLWYSNTRHIYYLDVDTLTSFDSIDLKINFLERLRDAFKQYMAQNGLSTTDELDWEPSGGMLLLQSDKIEQVYTQFDIFVEGFKKCQR
mgnify:CR=1 FL=1